MRLKSRVVGVTPRRGNAVATTRGGQLGSAWSTLDELDDRTHPGLRQAIAAAGTSTVRPTSSSPLLHQPALVVDATDCRAAHAADPKPSPWSTRSCQAPWPYAMDDPLLRHDSVPGRTHRVSQIPDGQLPGRLSADHRIGGTIEKLVAAKQRIPAKSSRAHRVTGRPRPGREGGASASSGQCYHTSSISSTRKVRTAASRIP